MCNVQRFLVSFNHVSFFFNFKIRKILTFWIRIQGEKYHPKTEKKPHFLPKSELLKKERLLKFPDFLKIHQVLA